MPFVNQRWLGGLLTNFSTISKRIDRLHELTALEREGQLDLLPTKERMAREAELRKLEYNLGGGRDMKRLPQAVFLIDLKTERSRCARRSDCASRSSPSSIPTATRIQWATRSPVTTTPSGPASS